MIVVTRTPGVSGVAGRPRFQYRFVRTWIGSFSLTTLQISCPSAFVIEDLNEANTRAESAASVAKSAIE